ncbi:MAG: putative ATPase, partial [Myxococcota bacterium]
MSQKSPCPTPARRGTNLPYEGSEFIGRECELAWLTEALAKGRPVEITGPCGAGKTRLSVHFGWQFLKATHAEVWFCDLSTARTGSEALTVLANIFDVPVDPDAEGGTILRAVDMAIRECGKGLLILDNYEQLASEAAELAAHIYRAAPEVHVLVTSRERVGLPGGENLALRPLPEDVAVRLFERRASALAPEFVVGEHNSAAVREIVRRMDALPLALEMAAPWIQILSAEELSNRLVTGLELRHDRTPATAHHTTMDRAIAWSWELLTDIDRGVLCLLGQFESLFDLSDAEALVGPEQCDTVLPCIRRLREHSLLLTTRVHGTGAITFQLYESVRGFVRRLPSAVEPEAAARYVNHIMTKSEALTKELHNGETPVLDQLFRLHHDLVA